MIELSNNECLTIVRKLIRRKNIDILNYSADRFGDFLGYLGEYYRLRITVLISGTKIEEYNFFVKSLPIIDIRSHRAMLIETGIFRKEMKIYQNLLTKFVELTNSKVDNEIWCPTIYLVRDDLIVFNDLTLQGYKVLPFSTFDFPIHYVEVTLKSLASLHAASIIFEQKEDICIGKEFDDILFETSLLDIPWFTAGLEVIRKVAENEFDLKNSQVLYQKILKVIEMMEISPFDVPKVLCHRDLWKNNLMFKANPLNCALIDFQTSRYLPLSVDVDMAILCTTRRAHYEKLMDHYLEFYYKSLEEKLSKHYIDMRSIMNYKNFTKSCEYHKKAMLVYKPIVVTITQVPQEMFKNFTKEDHVEYSVGDRYRYVEKFMQNDLLFKERVVESIKAVVEELL